MLSLGGGGGGVAGGARVRLAALAHQARMDDGVRRLDLAPQAGEGLLASSALLACVRDVDDVDEDDSFKENRPPRFTYVPAPLTNNPEIPREIDV